jgi:putative membrane protein
MLEISKEDREAISAAVRAAEQRTCGQLVCVLAHSSSTYAHVPIIWATALALVLPWPLIYFTQWSVERIFMAQLAVFIVAGLLFSFRSLRIALVPRAVRRARAHRAAVEQFFLRHVSHTAKRTGVLIYVSLAERCARIIADEGIAERVGNAEWQAAIDALIGHMRDGRIAAGFIAAVERCGAVLAEHAPSDGSPDVLPDRLYVM